LLARESAIRLAVFRITIGSILVSSVDVWSAPAWAGLPPELRFAPAGLGWANALLPFSVTAVRAGVGLLVVAAGAGAIGLFSRASFAVAAVAATYVLGVPQFAGAVMHSHHLIWFAALLAASPCGDALSVDAMLARRRGRPTPIEPSACYGFPIRVAWLLIACVFVFPGLWKLRASGLAWAWSDNLRNQMYLKWAQTPTFVPLFRIDRDPTLCRLLALAGLCLEVSFPLLIVARRLRPIAVVGALAFHAFNQAFLNIRFGGLWLCYTVFIDWDRVSRWFIRTPAVRRQVPGAPRRSLVPTAVMGGVLLTGNIAAGLCGATTAWPFACYPTFQAIAGAEMATLALEGLHADGSTAALAQLPLSQRDWGLLWSVTGARSTPVTVSALTAYWHRLRSRDDFHRTIERSISGARRVRFYREWISVVPETRGAVLRRELLAEIAADP